MRRRLISYCLSLAYKYLHIWPRQKARQVRCPFSSLCVISPDRLTTSRACHADVRPSRLPLSVFPHRSHSFQPTAFTSPTSTTFARLPPSLNKVDTCLAIGEGGTARAAIYVLHPLGASRIYLFNQTRRAQVPPPSTVVSTVPASATTSTTTGEHVPNALFLPSSLFSVDVSVVVDMAYKLAETPLLRLVKTVVAGRWHSVMGIEVLLEQGYRQFELGREGGALGAWCPRRLWRFTRRLRRLGLSFRPGVSWMRPHHGKK